MHERLSLIFMSVLIVASLLYIGYTTFDTVHLSIVEANEQRSLTEQNLNPICADTILRSPGGLGSIIARVCYNEHGWLRFNTNRLNDEQYERLIKPLDDRVRQMAREEGIYKSRYYD